jgi:RNA polymerase sigma factor (sigma-70 family)
MNRTALAQPALTDQLLRHAGWSRRLAHSLLGDESQAEDAVQDAWLAALRFRPRLDRPLGPWLRAVLRNSVINRRRGEGRRRAIEHRYGAGEVVSPPPPSPEELLERLQTQRLLAEVVSGLAEPYRQTVLLRYFEGRSSEEIAAQMRLPAATVRGRLRTALGELREALQSRLGGRRVWMIALQRLTSARERDRAPRLRPEVAAAGVAAVLRWLPVVLVLAVALALLWAPRWAAAPREAAVVQTQKRPAVVARPSFHLAPLVSSLDAETSEPGSPAAAVEGTSSSRAAAEPGGSRAEATITGTVVLVGTIPASNPVNMGGDPFCARFPGPDAGDLLVRDRRVANVVVRIVKGWTGRAAVPSEPVVLEQRGCRYHPRILAARAGQMIAVRNEDEELHEVVVRAGTSLVLSQPLGFRARPLELRADRRAEVLRFGCTTHPWMDAQVVVSETPFFAVTDEEGNYRLTGVPPGEYRLEAWHERLGTRQREVTVAPGVAHEASFDFGEEGPRPGLAGTGRCGIAVEGSSPVALACQKEGLRGAKRAMKLMVAYSKARGVRLECDSCHRNDTDWTLLEGARRRFESLPSRPKR